ncbi:hypothetical protein [[Scytonema hofmanni] UTEX B 1581]|uniref:hypothetical protein n=1 Tax=[Scytonema hofmanni] UTEX B 1581 TaxID=379535 RepID=UPI0004BAE764|nr:hypothetical protein [[Scytonema hofmanni] UTEX B 1581]
MVSGTNVCAIALNNYPGCSRLVLLLRNALAISRFCQQTSRCKSNLMLKSFYSDRSLSHAIIYQPIPE